MKIKVQTITVELRWQFEGTPIFVRSNVVGGFQAEVDGRSLRIYDRTGHARVNMGIYGLKDGMKMAGHKIAALIQGQE